MAPLEASSPYAPGYGHVPQPMFGRDDALHQLAKTIRAADFGTGGAALRLIGLRGTGKTSVLAEVQRRVTDRQELGRIVGRSKPKPWVVLRAEAGRNLAGDLADEINRIGPAVDRQRAWDVTLGASAPGIANVSAQRRQPPTAASLSGALKDLAAAASDAKRPMLVLIDELHEISRDDLRAIAGVTNQLSGSRYPVVMVTAELPDRLRLEHITYFSDRATRIPIGNLDRDAARAAIAAPARARGVEWDPDAVAAVVHAANGYPYALQVHADACWDAARTGDQIGTLDADRGLEASHQRMSDLYSQRWDQTPDRPRKYLSALALLEEGDRRVTTAEVAEALGSKTTSWSQTVAKLRDHQGAVTLPRRGTVTISLPGWAHWIRQKEASNPNLDDDTIARIDHRRGRTTTPAAGGSAWPRSTP